MTLEEKTDALVAAEERIAEMEATLSEIDAFSDFDDAAAFLAALIEDRERLLAAVGVTEHEWWCWGGARLRHLLEAAESRARAKKAAAAEAKAESEVPPVSQENVHVEEDVAPLPAEPYAVDNFNSVGAERAQDVVERFKESLRRRIEEARVEASEDFPPLPEEDAPPLPEEGLFSAPEDYPLTEEQQVAFGEVVEWFERSDEPFFSLTGPAGTGKTFLVRKIAEYFSDATLCAMTGKAALRVSEMTGRGASTLHKVLYFPPKPGEDLRFTRLREPPQGLVVVDESSQMTPSVKKDLGKWGGSGASWDDCGTARCLLVGDFFQLPPVITGKELQEFGESYSVFGEVSGASLKTVMRNAGGVLRAATRVRETGEMCTVSDMDGKGEGYSFVRDSDPVSRAVKDWLEDQDGHLLVSWRNAVRMRANRMIRLVLGHGGPIPDEGEPVLFRRNGQDFLNGEIVSCGHFEAGPEIGSLQTLWMHVQGGDKVLVTVDGGRDGEPMDGGAPWILDWRRFHSDLRRLAVPEPIPITFGYVLTAHSSQGSEARRVTVFLDRGDERSQHFQKMTVLPDGTQASFASRFLYTAQTRGKKLATLVVGR